MMMFIEVLVFYILPILVLLCVCVTAKIVYDAYKEGKRKGFYYMFLDDERILPEHYTKEKRWVICRSSEEAKQTVLKYGIFKFASFDHDLGGDDTTMKFLHWLAEEYYTNEKHNPGGKYLSIPGYVIHSQNPVGRGNIKSYMESWKRAYNNQNG